MDETFAEVAALLFGDGASDLVSKKMNDRKQRQVTAGLSAVGASAGAAGLALGGHNLHRSYKKVRATQKIGGRLRAVKAAVSTEKLATGLIPLEVAGLGGELMATKILHSDTKKPVRKSSPDQVDLHVLGSGGSRQGKKIRRVGGVVEPMARGQLKMIEPKAKGKLKKLSQDALCKSEYDIRWEGEISKVSQDKQQVFGWASIVELNGEPVVDLQGDYISIDEVEKSAYEYVHKSRKGGDMHLRDQLGGADRVVHKSDMIESMVMTPEKKEALGLSESTPTGWWVGYQVNDPELWAKVKDGKRNMFSIHGKGVRSDA